jgi:catechol 2,3-dioxygenase-like lactoylglutathione lyase family enzyme
MGAQIVVSVGSSSLEAAKDFYEHGLGLVVDRAEGPFVGFKTEHGDSGLAMYSGDPLSFEAGLVDDFNGIVFSCLVESTEQVDQLMDRAKRAGGQIRQPPDRAAWGGYLGYLTDPDGNLWKIVATQ